MKEKKILFLINSLNRGGAERMFVNQINFLVNHGWHSQIFLGLLYKTKEFGYQKEVDLSPDLIINLDGKNKSLFSLAFSLAKFIRKNNIKIIYSTMENANIVARLLKLFVPRLHIFIRESGTGDFSFKKNKPNFKKKIFKVVDIFLNFFSKKIIVLSEEMLHLASSFQPFYKNKIVVLPNGVEIVNDIENVENHIKIKKKDDLFLILLVGSMNVRERNYELVLQAAAQISKEYSDKIIFKFVGDGIWKSFYEEMADKLGVSAQIEFTGRLDSDSIKKMYMTAHVYLMTSLTEGCPNVILEAMSFGLPIISTRVGGVENIIDSNSGFLIDTNESGQIVRGVLKLFKDRDLWERMSLASCERVRKNFSLEKNVKKLLEILLNA